MTADLKLRPPIRVEAEADVHWLVDAAGVRFAGLCDGRGEETLTQARAEFLAGLLNGALRLRAIRPLPDAGAKTVARVRAEDKAAFARIETPRLEKAAREQALRDYGDGDE